VKEAGHQWFYMFGWLGIHIALACLLVSLINGLCKTGQTGGKLVLVPFYITHWSRFHS